MHTKIPTSSREVLMIIHNQHALSLWLLLSMLKRFGDRAVNQYLELRPKANPTENENKPGGGEKDGRKIMKMLTQLCKCLHVV